MILAFGGDDDAVTTPPLPAPPSSADSSSSSGDVDVGCSNPVTSGPLAGTECWWNADAWPPKMRKPSAAVRGRLMPIDERLEDLYAAVKQQQMWQHGRKESPGSVGAGRRIARSRSSRARSGIDQLLGCRDWSRRDAAAARIIVPDHLMNDSLSDSASSTTASFYQLSLSSKLLLARALQALSDPYRQSTCLCVYNFDAKYLRKKTIWGVRVQYGSYRKVPMARQLVTSAMASRDSMTSYSWRRNLQSRRIHKLEPGSTIRVDPLNKH